MLTREGRASNLYFMLRKKTRRLMGFLCSAMLVWCQLALSAYACPITSLATVAAAAEMPPDCAAEMATKASPLCKAHCEQPSQSSQTPGIDVPPVILISLGAVPLPVTPEQIPAGASLARSPWLADASPPLRIQYQVFRN